MQGEDRDDSWVLRRRKVLAPLSCLFPPGLGTSLRGRRPFSGDFGEGSLVSWHIAYVLGVSQLIGTFHSHSDNSK